MGKLIKRLKYKFSEEIADILGHLVVKRLEGYIDWSKIECVVVVPLSKERFSWRGFNQAELLARAICRELNMQGVTVPITPLLTRTRDTAAQAQLSRSERLTNLEGAFEFVGPHVPKSVLVVDDVYTTGATLNTCARTLREAGVSRVFGLAIAKKHV